MITTQAYNILISIFLCIVIITTLVYITHRLKGKSMDNSHLSYFSNQSFMCDDDFYNTRLGITKLNNFLNYFPSYRRYNVNFQSYLHALGLNYNRNVYLFKVSHLGKGKSMVVREYNKYYTYYLICFTTKGILIVPLREKCVSSLNNPDTYYLLYQNQHTFIKLSDINSLTTYRNLVGDSNNLKINMKNKSIEGHLRPHHYKQNVISSLKNNHEYRGLFK